MTLFLILNCIGDKSLSVPSVDKRKLSEVSNIIASQMDSLINSMSEDDGLLVKSPSKLSPGKKSNFKICSNKYVKYAIITWNGIQRLFSFFGLAKSDRSEKEDTSLRNEFKLSNESMNNLSQPNSWLEISSTPVSKPFHVQPQPISSSTPDSRDFGFGPNLSRISERTEFTDWSKSELDKTANSTYRPEILSSLSEKQKSSSLDLDNKASKLAFSESDNNKSGKSRSVLRIIFGCLFPFCKL